VCRKLALSFLNLQKTLGMKHAILGAIAGDIIGSIYEWNNVKTTVFPIFTEQSDFTDDTVLTIAVADCILNKKDFSKTIWEYGRKYTGRGYGGRFREWLNATDRLPYNSFGNGSAMRVSPVGFAGKDLPEVLDLAKRSAEVTHNHPEGIKGAQAVASAIFLARTGKTKPEIKKYIIDSFGYDLNRTINEIRPVYDFNETCQGSVPEAIIAFLESSDYESAIRLAISLGGDSDTIACITGGIAAAFYKSIPDNIIEGVISRLPKEFIGIIEEFNEKFKV